MGRLRPRPGRVLRRTTRLPLDLCPRCGEGLDAATSAFGDARPSPGSPSICGRCAGINVFGEDLRLRQPTAAEVAAFMADADVSYKLARLKRALLAVGPCPPARRSMGSA